MNSPTVLVVEDNEMNLELITDVLTLAGFKILTAKDALQAIEAATDYQPDLIVMDVQLPGMDGLEATRRLKARPATASIPVVAVTSHAMKGERERAMSAGCAAYFPKPIEVGSLAENLKKYLPGVRIQPEAER